MPSIHLETCIDAPVERVFDLARSIDLHAASMSASDERAVGGTMTGLIGIGETVTWEAVHFGFLQRLTSKITVCDRPVHLQDVMVAGAFRGFTHDHYLSQAGGQTLMRDLFVYASPLGFIGRIADSLFLEAYMTRLLELRNRTIKETAEGTDWARFIE